MAIIDYYRTLSRGEKSRFIQKVVEKTGIAYSTFFYKLQNNTFKKLEQEALENIIKEQKGNDGQN